MLRRLKVQNFRLLRDFDLELAEGVPTVLIGPNGSGKSTVLEVLDFLQRCATQGLQEAARAHGGINGFRTIGATGSVVIETTWAVDAQPALSLQWRLALRAGGNGAALVESEVLQSVATHEAAIVSTGEGGRRHVSVDPDQDVLGLGHDLDDATKLAFEVFLDPRRHPQIALLQRVLTQTTLVGTIDCAPAWRRADAGHVRSPRDSVVVAPQSRLDRGGIGLANSLFTLFNDHHEEWTQLDFAFRAEFPHVQRIIFPADAGGSRIGFGIEDRRFAQRKLYASELSDGMVSLLCLLVAILAPPGVSRVVTFDEPDANLHPSALARFVSMAQIACERQTVLIVTHSNALLDELAEPGRSIRIIESTADGARAQTFDHAIMDAWREQYSVSDMRRTGILDPSNGSATTEH